MCIFAKPLVGDKKNIKNGPLRTVDLTGITMIITIMIIKNNLYLVIELRRRIKKKMSIKIDVQYTIVIVCIV